MIKIKEESFNPSEFSDFRKSDKNILLLGILAISIWGFLGGIKY